MGVRFQRRWLRRRWREGRATGLRPMGPPVIVGVVVINLVVGGWDAVGKHLPGVGPTDLDRRSADRHEGREEMCGGVGGEEGRNGDVGGISAGVHGDETPSSGVIADD